MHCGSIKKIIPKQFNVLSALFSNKKSVQKMYVAFSGVLILSLFPIRPAIAGDISTCVICNEPNKVYQCTYSSPELTSSTVNLNGLQFACIKEVAQYGSHSQCAANRKSVIECNGEPYSLKNGSQLLQQTQTPTPDIEMQAEKTPPVKQPPTLVDSTNKTIRNTKNSLKKGLDNTKNNIQKGYDKTKDAVNTVGKGIKGASKSTYECVMSFFKNC